MTQGRTEGFFTFGVAPDEYDLPHPPLGLPVILLVRRVLLRAFELLREQNFQFATASEDEITAALKRVIQNNLLESGKIVPGFSKRTFNPIVRQGQWENYNGTVLTKTPDLFFSLRDDGCEPQRIISEFNGLFVECKPIDKRHPVGSKYCDDGLSRFVLGHYAWAMSEGMMLGYSRDDRTIAANLIPAMNEPPRLQSLATVELPKICPHPQAAAVQAAETIHISRHRRNFLWRDNKGNATDIQIYHLWHRCD